MTPRVTLLLLAQHVLFINIWSMTQAVLSSAPSLTTASISIHMCRLNFVQIVRKVFPHPFRCKIHEQGKLQARQM